MLFKKTISPRAGIEKNDQAIDRRTLLKYGMVAGASVAGAGLWTPRSSGSINRAFGPVCSNPVISKVDLVDKGGELELTVGGTGFDPDLGRNCMVFKDLSERIAVALPTEVSPTQIVGTIERVPDGMTEGCVMIAQGVGMQADPAVVPAGFDVVGPSFSWYNDGQPVIQSLQAVSIPAAFRTSSSDQAGMTCTYHVGMIDPVTKWIEIDVTDSGPDCVPGMTIKLVNDLRLSDGTVVRFDIQAPLGYTGPMVPFGACLTQYCTFITENTEMQTGGRLSPLCQSVDVGGRQLLRLFGINDTLNGNFLTFVSGTAYMKITRP